METLGMPDTESERFGDAIEWGARDVHHKWGKVFDLDELVSEAWAVAAERWQAWETTGMARTDTRLRVRHYVDSQLRSKGFARKTVAGKRKWVREYRETPASHYLGMFVPGLRQDTYADHDYLIVLLPGTRALNRRERHRYAGILFDDFPEVAAAFDAAKTARERKSLYWTFNMELRLAMQKMEMAR